MARIVGVEASAYEFAAVEGVVVGVHAGGGAAQRAHRIAGEHGPAEAGLVRAVVAALPGAAACLLGGLAVFGAASGVGKGGTARYGADGEGAASGHGDHLVRRTVLALRRVGVGMRADGALGVFVVGLAVFMLGVVAEFTVWMLVVGGLLMLGAGAATARQRRTGPAPGVTLRPGGAERPWRRNGGDE